MLLRSRVPELMDDPDLDRALHVEALDGLDMLNKLSGSASALWAELRKFENSMANGRSVERRTIRVLDVATGSGDNVIKLAQLAARRNAEFEFVGTDISPTAIDYAQNKATKSAHAVSPSHSKLNVSFQKLDVLNEKIPVGFDVVMTSLFTHHLDPGDVVRLLKNMHASGARMILVNDLVRSRMSYAIVWLASRLVTRSHVVHYDGPVSVQASYTPDEMKNMSLEAGLNGCTVKLHPPCRQILIWRSE